jgi:sugar lactone lactonase YvrE
MRRMHEPRDHRRRLGPGEVTGEVPAGTGVFACMLGGADGRTPFMCTAPDFDKNNRKNAREARLMAARAGTPRAGRP